MYVLTSWVYVHFIGICPASKNTYDGGKNMDAKKRKITWSGERVLFSNTF
jgi:hypothetical protein